MEINPYIDENELSKLTGISKSTWSKRRLTGDTPPFLKIGRLVRYRREDVQKWLIDRSRRSTADEGKRH